MQNLENSGEVSPMGTGHMLLNHNRAEWDIIGIGDSDMLMTRREEVTFRAIVWLIITGRTIGVALVPVVASLGVHHAAQSDRRILMVGQAGWAVSRKTMTRCTAACSHGEKILCLILFQVSGDIWGNEMVQRVPGWWWLRQLCREKRIFRRVTNQFLYWSENKSRCRKCM